MQLKFIILIAISLIYSVNGLLECRPNYCDSVKCALVEKNDCEVTKDGIFTERGGWCGCCPTCLHKIREGESCFGLLLRGTPPTVACDTGLHCDYNTHTCIHNQDAIN